MKAAEQAVEQPAEPVAGQAAEPVAGQPAEPAAGQAAEPAAGQAAEPAAGQAVEPAAGQAAEPAAGQAAEPAAEPAGERAGELAEITRRLDELTDLFVRRLSDDRARRAAVAELSEKLHQAELGPFRQYLQPFVHGLALVVDRLDRYEGADPEFAASIRAELLELLASHGVRQVAVGDAFDPAGHEAVEVRHDPDAPAGAVLEVRRAGFAHGSWAFRPAQVVVNADGSTSAVQ